jgi:hypothetical protein
LKALRLFFFDAPLAEGRGCAGFELSWMAKRCRVGLDYKDFVVLIIQGDMSALVEKSPAALESTPLFS